MTWTTSSGQLVSSSMTNDTVTGLFQSTVYITANTSDIPVHQCSVTFSAPTSDTPLPGAPLPGPIQATNAPTYSRVATSSAYIVVYCPRTIKLTLSKGVEFAGGKVEELTVGYCSVEDGSSGVTTTYTWTNTANGDVLSKSQNIAIRVVDYNLTCTANSTVNCGVGSTKTCDNLSKTISATGFLSDSDCGSHKTSTIALAVMLAITTVSTTVLAVANVYLLRHKKGRKDESVQQRQISTCQQDLADVTPRVYEQLNEGSLHVNNPVIYQELANNSRQRLFKL
jgi:hypothetical protein